MVYHLTLAVTSAEGGQSAPGGRQVVDNVVVWGIANSLVLVGSAEMILFSVVSSPLLALVFAPRLQLPVGHITPNGSVLIKVNCYCT